MRIRLPWLFIFNWLWNFFKNNLIDWCPASNTLGWRWVAGIQTIGKPYIAKAENIKHFTDNRFYPKVQSIIPSVVAFFHISSLFSKILIKFFKKGDLEEYVIKEIFDLNIYENLSNCKNEIILSDLFITIPKILPEKKEPEKVFQNDSKSRIIEEQKEDNNIIKENIENENVHNDVDREKIIKFQSTKEREKIIFDNLSSFKSSFSKKVEDIPISPENNNCYDESNKYFVKVNNFILNENEK